MTLSVAACAVQTPPVAQLESARSQSDQRSAQAAVVQQAPAVPALKRKVALGRITNETRYGQSLLRDRSDDPLGKQVGDLLSKALVQSGAYLVFERPDIGRVLSEGALTARNPDLIGVDALIVGSLTEFGRKTLGSTGFASASKRQVAFAKVDLRVVDVTTGQVLLGASGAGEASTETSSTFGFGSQAGYDGTLNDAAIRNAVSEAVNRITNDFNTRPWQTNILKADGGTFYLSGGRSQGIKPGMHFTVVTPGERVKSPQTGAFVTLPGRPLGTVRVDSLFGDSELNEGAIASLVSGAIGKADPTKLVVRFDGGNQLEGAAR